MDHQIIVSKYGIEAILQGELLEDLIAPNAIGTLSNLYGIAEKDRKY